MRIDIWYATGLQLRVRNRNLIFLFLNQNICCGYSKEPSQWDGSFEHPKHKLKLMGKKIFTILLWNPCSSKLMCEHTSCSYSVQPSLWDFPLGRKANVSQHRYDGQHNIHSHAYDAISNLILFCFSITIHKHTMINMYCGTQKNRLIEQRRHL